MASCDNSEVLTTKQTRSMIAHRSNDGACGWTLRKYGNNCQLLEVDSDTVNVRGNITEQRAWSYNGEDDCLVGETEDPPATPEITFRLIDQCGDGKIPFAETLNRCRVYLINNYGVCGETTLKSWSGSQRIWCVDITTKSGGLQSSNTRQDQTIATEITGRVQDRYTVSTVNWSQITNLGTLTCDANGTKAFCEAHFGCRKGCGQSSCGCLQACDNGTGTIYVPGLCVGSNFQSLWFSTDGGSSFKESMLPVAACDLTGDGTNETTPVTDQCPKMCESNGYIYMLAYAQPPVLMRSAINDYGTPDGWTQIACLDNGSGAGAPSAICCDSNYVHSLVNDPINGSSYYRFGGNTDPSSPIRLFDVAANMSGLTCCGGTLYVYGDNGALEVSRDSGITWSTVVVPAEASAAQSITSVDFSGDYLKLTTSDGGMFYSNDDGFSWSSIAIAVSTGAGITSSSFDSSGLGWLTSDGQAPFSTWLLGGIDADWWCNSTPRNKGWLSNVTPTHISMASCSEDWLKANAAIAVGTDTNTNESVLMIGKPQVA